MRVHDIMSSPVHQIWQNAPVESAAELMTEKSVTALPVVDANGKLVGMVSESDLLWHRVPCDPAAHQSRHPDTDPARRPGMVVEVMAQFPLVTTPDADVAEVADTMLQNDVRSLPVLDGDELVGIVSRRDILRAVVRSDDVLTGEVQHRLDEYAEGDRRWTVVVAGGIASVLGDYRNDTERAVVAVLARTVPGIASVRIDAVTAL